MSIELLETLAQLGGFSFISDIRFPKSRAQLLNALRQINPNNFVMQDWEDTLNYILGSVPQINSCEEAYEYLCRNLQQSS